MSRCNKSSLDTRNEIYRQNNSHENLKIYNIFTRFFTGPKQWLEVAIKAKNMGFNTIYLNPFQKMGASKSLYSIVDYFEFDPNIMVGLSHEEGVNELRTFIKKCKGIGLKVVLDFVSNHTAVDSPLVKKHSEWYVKDESGNVANAWCMSDSGKCVWTDCAKLDYSHPKNGLWDYMESVCRYYLNLGFDGFRCDVAAYVPKKFWKHLISTLKKDFPNVIFMGEAFMVPQETIDGLTEAGFDYIFNSAKWWNGVDEWFYNQNSHYNRIGLKTISFPDNHDTKPLMQELNENVELFKQRLFLMSVLTSGFEITSGFEYGIQTDYHVVKSCPTEFQNVEFDFSSEICEVIKLRDRYQILHSSGEFTNILPNSRDVLFLQKESINPKNRQKALILLNLTNTQFKLPVEKISSVFPVQENENQITLQPFGFKVYVADATLEPKIKFNTSNCLISKKCMKKKRLAIKPLYEDEVLVKVHACGICGSDRREFANGRFFWKSSEMGGHEFVGEVIQKGNLCKSVSVGDIVCYRIPRQYTGIAQFGGFSRYVVVRENCLYHLPSEVSKYKATMIEPLACAIHTGKMIGNDKSIAIIGSGTIAILLERYLATTREDKNIYLIYKHKEVCKFASKKTTCICFEESEKTRIFGVVQKFNTVVECSGDAGNFKKMMNMLANEGRIILTGIYNDSLLKNDAISLSTMMFRENKIQGSFLYTEEDFNEAAELILSGKIEVEDMILMMPFDKCQEAFEVPSAGRMKVIITK